MPEVNTKPRPAEDRIEPHAGATEPQAEIVVFLPPAAEVFVKAVDALEIAPPDAEIIADQLRLPRMSQKSVEPRLAMLPGEPLGLAVDMPVEKLPAPRVVFAERFRKLFLDPIAIAEHGPARQPPRKWIRDVIGAAYAIAVDEEQIRGRRRPRSFVAALRDLKRAVRVCREMNGEIDATAKLFDDLGRFIGRAVVGHDHFELARHPVLAARRSEANSPPQMPRLLIRGDADSDFQGGDTIRSRSRVE